MTRHRSKDMREIKRVKCAVSLVMPSLICSGVLSAPGYCATVKSDWVDKVRECIEGDDCKQALRLSEPHLQSDSSLAHSFRAIAFVRLEDLKWEEELAQAERSLKPDERSLTALGSALNVAGFRDVSFRFLKRSYDINPNNAWTLAELSFSCLSRGDRANAAKLANRALEIKRSETLAFRVLTTLNQREHHLDEALKYMNEAVQARKDAVNYKTRAVCFGELHLNAERMSDLSNAIKCLQRDRPRRQLAELLCFAHQPEKALSEGDTPTVPKIYLDLARKACDAKEPAKAFDYLNKADEANWSRGNWTTMGIAVTCSTGWYKPQEYWDTMRDTFALAGDTDTSRMIKDFFKQGSAHVVIVNEDKPTSSDVKHASDAGHTGAVPHARDAGHTDTVAHASDAGHTGAVPHARDAGHTDTVPRASDVRHTDSVPHTKVLGRSNNDVSNTFLEQMRRKVKSEMIAIKARQAQISEDEDVAIKLFAEAVNLDGDVYGNWCESGETMCVLGKYSEGAKRYSQAIKLRPGYRPAYYNRAQAFRSSKNFKEANADCLKVLQLTATEPGYARESAMEMITENYLSLGDNNSALQYANKSLLASPHLVKGLFARARTYFAMHNYDAALKDCDDAAEQNRYNQWTNGRNQRELSSVYQLRAEIYDKLGKHALAEADRRQMKSVSREIFDYSPFAESSKSTRAK